MVDEVVKKEIEMLNRKFGLKTTFFSTRPDFMSYTEGNVVYLNENTDSDIKSINLHEILHHFENSNTFKNATESIIKELGQSSYNELISIYYAKYNNYYNEKEILKGAITNELVIDIICNNIDIEKMEHIVSENCINKLNYTINITKDYSNYILQDKIKLNTPKRYNSIETNEYEY